MSFILEDKQLLNMLLKQSQAVQPQQYVSVSPEDVNAVRGLISGLEQKLTGGPTAAGAAITTGSGLPAELNSTNMKNLSSLVNWLGMNGIKVNGKNVVVGANDLPDDASYVPYQFEGDQTFRPSTQLTFKVNRQLLGEYLNSLRGEVTKNGNPVMKAQVEAMVRESNEQLDTNLGKGYQEPGQTLDPSYVMDNVPQRILTNTQLYGDGPIPLKYSDLADYTNFNAWIQDNKITVDDQPQIDQCGLLKFLHARAEGKIQNARSQQAAGAAKMYQQALAKLAPAFKCDLGGAQEKSQTDKQPGSGDSSVAILQLAQDLPLALNDIDFTRIEGFLSGYESLIGNNTDPKRASQLQTVKTAIEQARQYMKSAQQQTINGNMSNFPLNGLTSGDLVAWSAPPTTPGQPTRSRGSARALVDYLDYTVRNVVSVVSNFYYSYVADARGQDIFAKSPQLHNAVAGQTNVATSNLNRLGAARERLPQVGA